jgi:hypothetical protein
MIWPTPQRAIPLSIALPLYKRSHPLSARGSLQTPPCITNRANRLCPSVWKKATVLDRRMSFHLNTWLSHVGDPILPLRDLVAHRDDAYRVQSIPSALVKRSLWPGLCIRRVWDRSQISSPRKGAAIKTSATSPRERQYRHMLGRWVAS